MSTNAPIKLFLVDDDALLLKTLEMEFSSQGGFEISTFATGERCLEKIAENPDVIILDYHTRQDKTRQQQHSCDHAFLTG
jgi:two-component system OmpR family response regulator